MRRLFPKTHTTPPALDATMLPSHGEGPTVNRISRATHADTWAHRPTLDGVRTLAVYAVVLFHAGISWMRAGYVGVDVFFVLSGFLVTNVILSQYSASGSLNLSRFYSRRVRRLLPAAVVTILGTCAMSAAVEPRLVSLGFISDARASLLYVANWRFLGSATDYFAEDISRSPFLHFWSLAIEEQFYFAFPIFLLGLFALAKRFSSTGKQQQTAIKYAIAGTAALLAGSLASQLIFASSNPMRAYYATDTRLYQLAAGALLAAVGHAVRFSAPRLLLRFLPVISLVALGLVAIGNGGLGPWLRGILATIAAVGLIWSLETRASLQQHSMVESLLSSPAFTYLGRISYGTYLWHWPLIVLSKPLIALPSAQLAIFAGVGATALSALSYTLIETPIRTSAALHRAPRAIIVAGLCISVLAAALLVRPLLDGKSFVVASKTGVTPTLNTPEELRKALVAPAPSAFNMEETKPPSALIQPCEARQIDQCILHKGSTFHITLAGDSNAEMLIPALVALAKEHDFTLSATTRSGCPWQPGLLWKARDQQLITQCVKSRDEWYDTIFPRLQPDLFLVTNVPRDPGSRPDAFFEPGNGNLNGKTLTEVIAAATTDALDALTASKARVAILEPLPFDDFDPTQCLSGAKLVADCSFTANTAPFPTESIYRAEASARESVVSIDYDAFACPFLPTCVPYVNDELVYRNQFHLSNKWIMDHRESLWMLIQKSGVLTGLE